MKNGKRILNVTIKHMLDDSPDTSWLGEYSGRAETEYAIDRAHSTDCRVNTRQLPPARATHDVEDGICTQCDAGDPTSAVTLDAEVCPSYDVSEDCDCGGHGDMERNQFRFFNSASVEKGNTPEDNRKYALQDYERMESLNRGHWGFLGIRADAKIAIGETLQYITSGGLWGIESDSGADYFAEVEGEQLSELKQQLEALGFGKRAIAQAVKNVVRKDE